MEEELFEAPFMVQFKSEVRIVEGERKYFRIGTDVEFADAIYRVAADSNLDNLNKQEKLELLNLNNLIQSAIWGPKNKMIEKVLEYIKIED